MSRRRRMTSRLKPMRKRTSSGERFQFSVEKAYAELIYMDVLWPDFDRRHLWHACELYAQRDRRFGGAIPNPVPVPAGS